MVKLFAVVALVVAAMTAEAAVVAPDGHLDVNPVTLLEKRRDCCKTTYVKCELFKQSLRSPGAYRAIFKDPENNRHLASFDFNGLSPDWVQECSAGYCYAVRGSFRTCKFWVDDSRVGECETKGWFYETCTASFCNIYC